jgi:glycosyltransferase involved in cell wall biosynthesis
VLTTVTVPAYNAEDTLRGSVESALGQTAGDLEVVVVDDGSRVPAAEVLADLRDERLRVVRHERNRGVAAARNTALAAVRTPLMSQLDADDLWEPDYLGSVLGEFGDPRVGLVYTNATILGHPEGHDDYISDASIHPRDRFPELAEANPVPCPTVTMRAEAVRGVGGYASHFATVADWHLYMRIAATGWRFAYVDRRLARYRWPEPGRGLSYDVRSLERRVLVALAVVALRHPRLPGIWPALLRRVRRGGDHGPRGTDPSG